MNRPQLEPEVAALQRADDEIDRLGRVMAAALDSVQAILKAGHPYKCTIVLRNTEDPEAHAMVGTDTLDGLAQFIGEMAACEGRKERIIKADGRQE